MPIVLEGSDFARLMEKALTAIGQWLAAGGGLLVMADAVFDPGPSAEALRSWSASDDRGQRKCQFDADGKLIEPIGRLLHAHASASGRLAITPQRPEV
jgi:hypothetical protein